MSTLSLEQTVRRYPGAPHAFFRIINYPAAEASFLNDPSSAPHFLYGDRLERGYLTQRLQGLQQILVEAEQDENEPLRDFATRRIAETQLLLASVQLQAEPHDQELLQTFRGHMEQLYGSFDEKVFAGLLQYLQDRARVTGTKGLYVELEQCLNSVEAQPDLVWPGAEVFEHYRSLVLASSHPLAELARHARHPRALAPDAMGLFRWALDASGANEEGWKSKLQPHLTNVQVSRHTKRVLVGEHFQPRSELRLSQVVAHEVFVHVERNLRKHAHINSIPEEEGVAIVVEQLLAERFVPKRSLRYLAAAAAWGVDGKPRNFVDTFEIVWRAFCIVGAYDEATAKRGAFRECVRVFRGGVPALVGAAFIKDKIYLEANLKVWQHLQRQLLDEAAFFAYIQGEGEAHATGNRTRQ